MKRIYVARNPADAHLVKGLLEGGNIAAVVRGEFLWGVRGEVPLTPETSPSVWVVDDSDYDRAKEMVSSYELEANGTLQASREWKCPQCGEVNEGGFTDCWNCGTGFREIGEGRKDQR